MTALSLQLAEALNELPFVQALEHEQAGNALNVLCRVKPGSGVLWASLAEHILREASLREGKPEQWHTHIARLYMLREGKLVYGWVFVIQSADVVKTAPVVVDLILRFIKAIQIQEKASRSTQHRRDNDDYDQPEEIEEDNDYSEPETPMPKGYVPEADEKGNPIVPREHRVKTIQMAGLPKDFDRNAPDPEKRKGSWSIESRKGKPFRPPVRG